MVFWSKHARHQAIKVSRSPFFLIHKIIFLLGWKIDFDNPLPSFFLWKNLDVFYVTSLNEGIIWDGDKDAKRVIWDVAFTTCNYIRFHTMIKWKS